MFCICSGLLIRNSYIPPNQTAITKPERNLIGVSRYLQEGAWTSKRVLNILPRGSKYRSLMEAGFQDHNKDCLWDLVPTSVSYLDPLGHSKENDIGVAGRRSP